jgi:hypothetical protein
MEWFKAAFTARLAALRRVKVGTNDRSDLARCEHACLHELAHIVTGDYAPAGQLREEVREIRRRVWASKGRLDAVSRMRRVKTGTSATTFQRILVFPGCRGGGPAPCDEGWVRMRAAARRG